MSISVESLEKEALQLPEDQRITLAHKILASTEPEIDSEISGWWDKEITARIERLDAGTTERHSASDVFKELDARMSE